MKNIFRYIKRGIKAESHSPIYKMHKYFARRPHNVFRHLIESYTEIGDTILDPFCGGGVTLIEGLSTQRKVIAVDINPLATFITDSQSTPASIDEYCNILKEVHGSFKNLTKAYYSTTCRECGRPADIRWYELSYYVMCPSDGCGKIIILSNENKLIKEGKAVNGSYTCSNCNSSIAVVDQPRIGYDLTSVIYRCSCKPNRQVAKPTTEDKSLMEYFEKNFDQLIEKYNLWYPDDLIPEFWDRQKEDCLHRKSIAKFKDLFTKRSLFFNAYLLKLFQRYKGNISPELYNLLLFTFSAIIRHTNSMTFSTDGWMDGRPVSWAKHAYWTPNQFVEVNPLEYVEKRRNAILSGLKYQRKIFANAKKASCYEELKTDGSHIIWTRSSETLPLPDNVIDAVITDPPYGSNVQYGELSYFWLVWLKNEILLDDNLFLNREILVHRKAVWEKKKDYLFYFEGLCKVFRECFRVLKTGGVLVFTFNNKDMRAWYAVINAAIKAGFYLDQRGVIYQEPIEDYKNTAHLRFAGSIQGDFIHTFKKQDSGRNLNELPITSLPNDNIEREVKRLTEEYLFEKGPATTSELHIAILPLLIPTIVSLANNEDEFAKFNSLLSPKDLENIFSKYFIHDEKDKTWRLQNNDGQSREVITDKTKTSDSITTVNEFIKCNYLTVYTNEELAKHINEFELSLSITNEEELFKDLVNTSVSSKEPYHRWARYREGYSGKLVKELICRSGINRKEHFVYDPMGGSGSTIVAASQLGYDSICSDINPYAVDLSMAKVTKYDHNEIREIESFIQNSRSKYSQLTLSTMSRPKSIANYYSQNNLVALEIINDRINNIKNKKVKKLLFVAWLSILEECSERKKDGNGLVPRKSKVIDVWDRFNIQVKIFLEDIKNHPFPSDINSSAILESAKQSQSTVNSFQNITGKKLGTIIFSPPYANSFDYFESYKIELLFGGYYDEKGLVKAREGAIRNYRKGYGYQLSTDDRLVNMLCEEILSRIPIKEAKTGRPDGRTKLVPNLLIGYFQDMEQVIKSFYNCMSKGSMCHIVVDQSSYLGVIIPTDLLLANIAIKQGFDIEKLIYCRVAKTSAQQLNEYPYLKTMLRESIVSLKRV